MVEIAELETPEVLSLRADLKRSILSGDSDTASLLMAKLLDITGSGGVFTKKEENNKIMEAEKMEKMEAAPTVEKAVEKAVDKKAGGSRKGKEKALDPQAPAFPLPGSVRLGLGEDIEETTRLRELLATKQAAMVSARHSGDLALALALAREIEADTQLLTAVVGKKAEVGRNGSTRGAEEPAAAEAGAASRAPRPVVIPASDTVHLNVGGVPYVASAGNLARFPGSALAAIVGSGGDHPAPIYVDRDGPSFRWIAAFLRDPDEPVIIPSGAERALVEREARFFGLDALAEAARQPEKIEYAVLPGSGALGGMLTGSLGAINAKGAEGFELDWFDHTGGGGAIFSRTRHGVAAAAAPSASSSAPSSAGPTDRLTRPPMVNFQRYTGVFPTAAQ
jgi:hypothetical protein